MGNMLTVRGSVLSGELPVSRHGAGRASPRRGTAWSGGHTALAPAAGAANPGSGGTPRVEGHSCRDGTAEHPGRSPLCARCGSAAPCQWSWEGRWTLESASPQSSPGCGAGPEDAPDPWGDVRTGGASAGQREGQGPRPPGRASSRRRTRAPSLWHMERRLCPRTSVGFRWLRRHCRWVLLSGGAEEP